jgi:hypothetical protein
MTSTRFARRVFSIAAIYGVLVLVPQYFLETKTGLDYPPPITHSEYYYGFIGVALAWQMAFWIISRDPVRYRPIMLAAIVEKATWATATTVLFLRGSLSTQMLGAGMMDLLLGILFSVSYLRTPARASNP